ncbi:MAG TPA: protease modulator HflK [Pedomonas sp.]|uniref:protease modulator HflK n=1 Tax=Pedomonas sp. TaxID=2976421 RepID=UPI002F40170C
MPWQNNGGSGGPWGSGGGSGGGPRNPWGGGSGGGGGGGGQQPPNLDDLIRRGQERLRATLPGGTGGGNVLGLAVGALVLLWLATSSIYRVNADEVGVVQRFGAYVRQSYPGLHFKLPAPFETVTKPKVTQENTIEIGAADRATETLVLTSDQNIVDISYTVRWKISDAPNFLFRVANPELTIREVAESAMREAISSTPLNAAIGEQRGQVAQRVQNRMQEVLDSYDAGVEVTGVFFRQVDPPAAAEQAFKDVSAAQQDAQSFLNQANAYRQQLVAKAQGEAARFNAVYEQYKLAPAVTRKRIYLETMEDVLSDVDKVILDSSSNNVVPYLPLNELNKRRAASAATTAQD